MTEKAMTQVQALEIAAAEVTNEEARAVIEKMIEKRKAPRKPRVNKAAVEFAERVYEYLTTVEDPQTNGDVAAVLSNGAKKDEEGYVSFQKVAAAMRRLIAEERVECIPGEKAKDKKTYKVVG